MMVFQGMNMDWNEVLSEGNNLGTLVVVVPYKSIPLHTCKGMLYMVQYIFTILITY